MQIKAYLHWLKVKGASLGQTNKSIIHLQERRNTSSGRNARWGAIFYDLVVSRSHTVRMMMVGVGDDDVKSGCATRRTKNEYRRNVTQHAVENRMDRWSKGAPSQLRFTRLRIIKFNIIFRKVIVGLLKFVLMMEKRKLRLFVCL